MAGHRISLRSRFWRKVERGEHCWSWSGAHKQGGVPVINVGGRVRPAHRIAWELAYGAPDEARPVFHRCANKACVRPDHLTQDQDLARRASRRLRLQAIESSRLQREVA